MRARGAKEADAFPKTQQLLGPYLGRDTVACTVTSRQHPLPTHLATLRHASGRTAYTSDCPLRIKHPRSEDPLPYTRCSAKHKGDITDRA